MSKPHDRVSIAGGGAAEGGYNSGMAVFSYIIGGILVWSLIGWGLDIFFGTHWIVLLGAFLGLAGGFYLSFAKRLTPTQVPPREEPGSNNGAMDDKED